MVRFIGLDFDQRHHFHPDERAIADAVGRLSFDPSHPQLNPKFFAYGSFPLYIDGIVTSTLANIPALRGYDERILVGRGVSAAVGALTVLLLALLGARLYNFQVGMLAGGLLAACVLHVQNSHFMATDVFLTLIVLVALYFLIGLVQRGRTRDYVYSGLAIGLAGATKFSAMPLLAPLGVAILFRLFLERRFAPVFGKGVAALLAVAAGFVVGQPYAILDFPTFSRQITEQSNMVRHAGLLPYTNQYIGVPKYLYEIEQIVLWCMGPALGLAALWATAKQTVNVARDRSGAQLVLLSWVIPYFLVTGWFEVKFVRYLLPIYPIVILWAAAWLWEKAQRSRLGRVALWTVVGMTLAQMLAFLSIYQRPHTVVTASDWVYRNIPAGSTLLTQHWDEGFPFSLPHRPPHDLKVVELPYYDGEIKMGFITQQLAKGDYLAFQTKRLYGAITRAPQKYPLTNNYFYLLFAGDLGYTLVYDYRFAPEPVRLRAAGRARGRVDHRLRPSQGPDLQEHRAPELRADPREGAARHSVEEARPHRPAARAGRRGRRRRGRRREPAGPLQRPGAAVVRHPGRGARPERLRDPLPMAAGHRLLRPLQGPRHPVLRLRSVAGGEPGAARLHARHVARRGRTAGPARLPGAAPLAARAPALRVGGDGGSLLGGVPLLSRHPRLQPRDLLGREADGLLLPQRPLPQPSPAAAGAVVLGLAALLHVLRALRGGGPREGVPHPPRPHVQPRHRPVRGADRQRGVRPGLRHQRALARRPAGGRAGHRVRQPRRAARDRCTATS